MKKNTIADTKQTVEETTVQVLPKITNDAFSSMGLSLDLTRDDVVSVVTSRVEEETLAAIADLTKKRTTLNKDLAEILKDVEDIVQTHAEKLLAEYADELTDQALVIKKAKRDVPGQTSEAPLPVDQNIDPRIKTDIPGMDVRMPLEKLAELTKYTYSIHSPLFTIQGSLCIPDTGLEKLGEFRSLRKTLACTEENLVELKTSLNNIGRFERQARARITENVLKATVEGQAMLEKLSAINSGALRLIGKSA